MFDIVFPGIRIFQPVDRRIILEKHYRSEDIETSEAFLETIFDGISEEIMVVNEDGLSRM